MKQNNAIGIFTGITLLFIALFGSSCDDFLDIKPTGRVIPQTAADFRQLLTEAYRTLPSARGLTTFRSDEADLSAGATEQDIASYKDIWTWNDDNPDGTTISFEWKNYYTTLFIANSVIENEKRMTGGLPNEVSQLTGEAYMLRALIHFTLVNLYAVPYHSATAMTDKGIPLKLNTDVDQLVSRNTVQEVYTSILSDIGEAQKRLNVEQWDHGLNYRFNTISAEAFKSRIYLYMGDWKASLAASRKVLLVKSELANLKINGTNPPNHYTSVESIVALEWLITASYQNAGRINSSLLNMYIDGDRRKSNFYTAQTSSIYKLKKGGGIEYRCSFRTGEIYLNAAEAAIQDPETDIEIARDYLLTLLENRYTVNAFNTQKTTIEAMDKTALRTEIYQQRFLELAYEGHRWFDLRRTSQPKLEKVFRGETFTLEESDLRYTLKIPNDAILNNPSLANEYIY
ncbi:MAG: hypothetical protein EZS26_001794 [Candidatus Ordinivivax streblomastigis]|uniref:RagB/SusD family nutrient uptake outer membrane protein n=1 Tax=Candidatus Ordinivivax streblomastigis TaxID=2540710 RepID=A0A5M8P0Q9_9BACT|nr:MAG: hypothetical protein EZS26_001794 [Candidatus Ordinivivax streblomastigis]